MGIEAIVAGIERDAADEAASTIATAHAQAAALVAAAETEVDARVGGALERAAPIARGEAARRVNAVRLRVLEGHAASRAALVAGVFTAAADELAAIIGADPGVDPPGHAPGSRWQAAVHRLALGAIASAGGGTLAAREPDLAHLADVARDGVTLQPLLPDAPPGPRVVSPDGRAEIDATVPVRLARARTRLAGMVAETLGLDAEERS